MLLVVAYSRRARTSLRNACRTHEGTVVRRFGRAALLEPTAFGAFLALWLREKHPDDVQVERTVPLVEYDDVPAAVCRAARAYEAREHACTPYAKFAAGSGHPDPADLKATDLDGPIE